MAKKKSSNKRDSKSPAKSSPKSSPKSTAKSPSNSPSEHGTQATGKLKQAALVVAKLDPVLLLAAAQAKSESSTELHRLAALTPVALAPTPQSLDDVPVGICSLAAQMSPTVRDDFYKSDLVPVMVATEDTEAVAKQVAQWKGASEAVTASVLSVSLPRQRLEELAKMTRVQYIEASHRLKPHNDLAHVSANRWIGNTRTSPHTGRGVLIGIVDTGIDCAHRAFWSGTKSRIVHYHDQTKHLSYSQADIENGQAAASPDVIGHGTHVAGIAAGNGTDSPSGSYVGVAPEADLAIVKTTFQSDDIAKAVKHIFDLATARQQPCVVNLSLGGHFGGHDGSSITERAIDELSGTGRLVVVSAGNEGSDRIHASTVLQRGGATASQWTADLALKSRLVNGSPFGLLTLQVWTQHEDDLQIRLRSPNGEFFEPNPNSQTQVNRGSFIVQASHQVAHYSGDNVTTFLIFTLPQHQWLRGWSVRVTERRAASAASGASGIQSGVRVGAVHCWILDVEMGEFTQGSTFSHLVGMPGTSYSAITVGSYATRKQWQSRDPANPNVNLSAGNLEDISYFSSPGPTRDGHNKPEIAAPGQWLLSALSADAPESEIPKWMRVKDVPYAAMQGTSMSAPYVAGALALLLEKHPQMDWAEAKRRIIKSTRQDEFTTPCWNPRWGYGKLNVDRLLNIDPGP